MKTYLTLWFNSEGAEPSEVIEKLTKLGFKAVAGNYDMEYAWDAKPTTDEVLNLGDLAQKRHAGTRTLFSMETL